MSDMKKIAQLLSNNTAVNLDPSLRHLTVDELLELIGNLENTPSGRHLTKKNKNERWQDKLILQEIPENSSVLDLGCGEGNLLKELMANKKIKGQGFEIADEAVFRCIEKGIPVFQGNLDEGLGEFDDKSFDYVILEETLQTLHNPVAILREMLRVGKKGIVSFPNFGYWRVRLDLALRGRMPVTEWLPYHWYDTPNIHLLTLQDFFDWAEKEKVSVENGYLLSEGEIKPLDKADNLFSDEALLIIEKNI